MQETKDQQLEKMARAAAEYLEQHPDAPGEIDKGEQDAWEANSEVGFGLISKICNSTDGEPRDELVRETLTKLKADHTAG